MSTSKNVDAVGISGDTVDHQPPGDDSGNIPSQHLCPIIQEPPFDAVHFDVPSASGTTIPNQQAYKRSALYQCIATQGTDSAQRNMYHPFTRSPIARHIAWEFVRPVVPTLQEVLHRERQTLGLILEDDNPLNDND